MESVRLCVYCDNSIKENDTKCSICEAEIDNMFINIINKKNSPQKIVNTVNTLNHEIKTDTHVQDKFNEKGLIARGFEKTTLESLESTWTCGFCTLKNKSNLLSCEACFHDNSINKEEIPSKTDEILMSWLCSSCQFHNEKDGRFCQACHQPKEIDKTVKLENISETQVKEKIEENNEFSHFKTELTTGNPWKCMKCSYINDMPSLKCFCCEHNNQIYRICTRCNIYFIMEDINNLCIECFQDDRDKEDLLKSTNFKDSDEKLSGKRRSIFERIFLRDDHWHCQDPACNQEMKGKLNICTNCGKNKVSLSEIPLLEESGQNVSFSLSDDSKISKKEQKLNKKKVPQKDLKNWICDDQKCLHKNKSKGSSCKKCSRSKPPADDFIEGNETISIFSEFEGRKECEESSVTQAEDEQINSSNILDTSETSKTNEKLNKKKKTIKNWKCDDPKCHKKNKAEDLVCKKCKKSKTILEDIGNNVDG